MEQDKIWDGNKTIAKFMGAYQDWKSGTKSKRMRFDNPINGTYSFLPSKMKYHESWDWLMSVVDGIEKLDTEAVDCRVTIERKYCKIYYHDATKKYNKEYSINAINKIESVYKSVIEFIKWYNEKH